MDKKAKPHADTALDPESLDEPPTSNQYYLYSRVDGEQTVEELCQTSGLGRQQTLDALEELHRLGLIVVPGLEKPTDQSDHQESTVGDEPDEADERQPSGDESLEVEETDSLDESTAPLDEREEEEKTGGGVTVSPEAAKEGGDATQQEDSAARTSRSEIRGGKSSAETSASAAGVDFSKLPIPPAEIDIDDELLEMDLDLKEPFRRELVALSRQLDDINYYEFYGIEPDADVGEIKKSYFHLSKRYHPDKHFGGELGPFKEMLEEVFQHITRAYRILTNEDRREEYDTDLGLKGGQQEASEPKKTASPDADSEPMTESSGPSRPSEDEGKKKQEAASRLLVNRAQKYRERGQIDDAADEYQKAVSLNRRLETALEAAEMLVDAEHRLDDAAVFARAALKLDEGSAEGYYLLGRSYEGRDLLDEAVESYRHAVELEEHQEASRRLERLESEGETS